LYVLTQAKPGDGECRPWPIRAPLELPWICITIVCSFSSPRIYCQDLGPKTLRQRDAVFPLTPKWIPGDRAHPAPGNLCFANVEGKSSDGAVSMCTYVHVLCAHTVPFGHSLASLDRFPPLSLVCRLFPSACTVEAGHPRGSMSNSTVVIAVSFWLYGVLYPPSSYYFL
jgi:hypothetical protein